MSSRSPRLRPLRSRSEQSITDNDTEEKIVTEGEEVLNDDNNPDENITMTEEINNSEFENIESTEVINEVEDNDNGGGNNNDDDDDDDVDDDDDSDSDEPRLVIKEEQDDNLIDENNIIPENRTYNCSTCESKPEFKNLVDYLDHLKEQHHEKWNLDRHNRSHGGDGPLQCRACNFTADIRQSLTVHEMNHHEPPIGMLKKQPSPSDKNKSNAKRYNQVGGSDYRDNSKSPIDRNNQTKQVADKSNDERMEIDEDDDGGVADDDATNEMASAGCISLRCEEKDCPFITSWDSEMQRHLIEAHSGGDNKSKKPLPMLIPLSPGSKSTTTTEKSPNILNVPRVRVRPELAKIARDTEIAKLYRQGESSSKTNEIHVSTFEKRNAIFFEKLKERLNTTTSGLTPIAVCSNTINNNLKCWCTYQASSQYDYDNHKKTHHTALSVLSYNDDEEAEEEEEDNNYEDDNYDDDDDNIEDDNYDNDDYDDDSSLKCPFCNESCKNENEKNLHIQVCVYSDEKTKIMMMNYNKLKDMHKNGSAVLGWDGYHALDSSGSSVDGTTPPPTTTTTTSVQKRKVFKCPHCQFWATTASRFHVHIVGHLNRKPFECSLCSYRSNWRWDITKHIKLKSARDNSHKDACVLMTDETGRRNYSKYNKYLVQMEIQTSDDPTLDESHGEIHGSDNSRKLIPLKSEQPDFRSSRVNSKRIKEALSLGVNLSKELTINGEEALQTNSVDNTTASTSAEETKKVMWKCKKCQFRAATKELILKHVRSHYGNLLHQKTEDKKNDNNEFQCPECPFIADSETSLAIHKVLHRENLQAVFKCYLCPYYVNTKSELLEHVRLHNKNIGADSQTKMKSLYSKKSSIEKKMMEASGSNEQQQQQQQQQPPPLVLDTRLLPSTPMVWVSHGDTFLKMLKCRHCPFVSIRRVSVDDHEAMHKLTSSKYKCTDCSFSCNNFDMLEVHKGIHNGSLGKVHCLVDDKRNDTQQLDDLKVLLGLKKIILINREPDLIDNRLLLSCNMCPARFLCEKELNIHLRYHSMTLSYTCEYCSYTARHLAHLQSHNTVHTNDYQDKTRELSAMYGNSQRYPPPMTACIETKNKIINNSDLNIAWIVVEIANNNTNNNYQNSNNKKNVNECDNNIVNNQVYTCDKCPAKYFEIDKLKFHMSLHGSNNDFKCQECDYSSKTSQNLMKHQIAHQNHKELNNIKMLSNIELTEDNITTIDDNYRVENNKRYKCEKCPSTFDKREEFKIHLGLHGSKNLYRCDKCDYSVKYYPKYTQHVRKHLIYDTKRAKNNNESMDIDLSDNEINNYQPVVIQSRRKSTMSSGFIGNFTINDDTMSVSNQDKQAALLAQKKIGNLLASVNETNCLISSNSFKCCDCPYSTNDIENYNTHKRRHRTETQTPSCPYCNYVPKKDENIADHKQLHFTRLYKPEAFLIVDNLSLTMKIIDDDEKKDNFSHDDELLFREVDEDTFLPVKIFLNSSCTKNTIESEEKIIVDPNTGETIQTLTT